MSAREQWSRELSRGERTAQQWDALFFAAQQEAADEEFDREYGAPQRLALAEAQQRARPEPEAPIADGAHALERWRQLVLESDRKRAPLDVAAAWELTAVECDRMGHAEQAEEARARARAQLKRSVA